MSDVYLDEIRPSPQRMRREHRARQIRNTLIVLSLIVLLAWVISDGVL